MRAVQRTKAWQGLFGLAILLLLFSMTNGFVSIPPGPFSHKTVEQARRMETRIFSLQTSAATDTSAVQSLIQDAEKKIIESRGNIDIEALDPLLVKIELENSYDEPNRLPIYKGQWHVWYSTAPPPSNGQLGPFRGSSEQEIAPSGDSYRNILRLPPNSKDDEWLTVVLDGIWEDWNGQIREDDEAPSVEKPKNNPTQADATYDWGAKHWIVTFLRLNFFFFGNQILSKEFPGGVSRIWRTTYLDEDTKIVRAGRTGRPDDEYVFYMKRSPRPTR